ncbi:hypothetical protein F2Q69_00050781 [Brassica cretica]|uniref:glycerophosphodiester phosphodiesterase n=1 Tax=Brassica cretica TaxID=69181 RepID=A0A8S9Q4X8_BRACR|nr:hypothetical protein F2Q69_00050781 [Brassica cretica]
MSSFLISASTTVSIDYISSPEVNFFKKIAGRFGRNGPSFVFQFLGKEDFEPTTNRTYGSILSNLTFVKTFALGILVPKSYILPLDDNQYLVLPPKSLVLDAHKAGLQVYVSGFVNDNDIAHDYSSDPVSEYLSFVDNGNFSVDGVLSDFPITASASIGKQNLFKSSRTAPQFADFVLSPFLSLFSHVVAAFIVVRISCSSPFHHAFHLGLDNVFVCVYVMWALKVCGVSLLKLWSLLSRALCFFTYVGALSVLVYFVSGEYPGCTDMAYDKAIKDGADVIDCSVQMSSDGKPFCSSSIDLSDITNIAQTPFAQRSTHVPEISSNDGIYTFSLTWSEIQTLKQSLPPQYMAAVPPGFFLNLVNVLPPAQAPNPVFTDDDVTEPPLPPVTAKSPTSAPGTSFTNAQAPRPSGQTRLTLSLRLSVFASLLLL